MIVIARKKSIPDFGTWTLIGMKSDNSPSKGEDKKIVQGSVGLHVLCCICFFLWQAITLCTLGRTGVLGMPIVNCSIRLVYVCIATHFRGYAQDFGNSKQDSDVCECGLPICPHPVSRPALKSSSHHCSRLLLATKAQAADAMA